MNPVIWQAYTLLIIAPARAVQGTSVVSILLYNTPRLYFCILQQTGKGPPAVRLPNQIICKDNFTFKSEQTIVPLQTF